MRKVINAATGALVLESANAAQWFENQSQWRLPKDESEVMPELRQAWAFALAIKNDPLFVVAADDGATAVKIEDVPYGEYVKRKPDSKKVYIRREYIRSGPKRGYWLEDTDDISKGMVVPTGKIVYIGFTY
jgi:hypothetical protein